DVDRLLVLGADHHRKFKGRPVHIELRSLRHAGPSYVGLVEPRGPYHRERPDPIVKRRGGRARGQAARGGDRPLSSRNLMQRKKRILPIGLSGMIASDSLVTESQGTSPLIGGAERRALLGLALSVAVAAGDEVTEETQRYAQCAVILLKA